MSLLGGARRGEGRGAFVPDLEDLDGIDDALEAIEAVLCPANVDLERRASRSVERRARRA